MAKKTNKKRNYKRKTMKGGVKSKTLFIERKASNYVTNLFDNVVNNNKNNTLFKNAPLSTPRIMETIRPSSKEKTTKLSK